MENSITPLSPSLKERRRQTLKYFAQTQDYNEQIMDFLQNQVRRKPYDNDSDCKDDFDSDVDVDVDENELENDHLNLDNNIDIVQDRGSENDELIIQNGEEPSWKELLLDDSTRQQFEEFARKYVGNIADDKRKLQNEHYQLQQKYLKLQETNKVYHNTYDIHNNNNNKICT